MTDYRDTVIEQFATDEQRLLDRIADAGSQERVRDLILEAYASYEALQT